MYLCKYIICEQIIIHSFLKLPIDKNFYNNLKLIVSIASV